MKVLCYQEVVRPHRCSCPMSGHCKGVCIPDTMVCALVRGFPREVRRGWQSQKPLIFMHFHEVFLGSQHEIWSKQHNGKVRSAISASRSIIGEGEGFLNSIAVLSMVHRGAHLQSQTLLALCGLRSS